MPLIIPNIEKLSLKNPEEINTLACTLRENCKNITVTPDNVYPARPLCSNITIGYNENDSREYDFSDTICSNITTLVEDTFNNVHIKEGKDGQVGKIKDGVYKYTFLDGKDNISTYKKSDPFGEAIKKVINGNGYGNLIQEYCHCLNQKPNICELF